MDVKDVYYKIMVWLWRLLEQGVQGRRKEA
jgi:hypothetical protein